MASYELRIAILGAPVRARSQVRAWIDRNLSSSLASERELKLTRDRECWSARFRIPSTDCQRFVFRVGVVADRGAIWQVSIRDCAADRAVFEDSDVLADAKQWLLGTCDVVNDDERIERRLLDSLHCLKHHVRSVMPGAWTRAVD